MHMENVVNLNRTAISSASKQSGRTAGNARSLSFLGGEALVYATNLIRDWEAQLLHLDGLKKKSVESHSSNLFRLLNHAQVAPWELKPVHVSRFFESRMSKDGHQLAPSTVAVYCAGWRSFQAYMLDMERVNEIQ
ncbi:recombinase, partial [Pseudomonas aeruginosa]|nr:recombinase [Pseudomonas aeruginosa]